MDRAPPTAAPPSQRARPSALITFDRGHAPAGHVRWRTRTRLRRVLHEAISAANETAVAATAGERVDMPMAEPPDNEDRLPDAVRTTQDRDGDWGSDSHGRPHVSGATRINHGCCPCSDPGCSGRGLGSVLPDETTRSPFGRLAGCRSASGLLLTFCRRSSLGRRALTGRRGRRCARAGDRRGRSAARTLRSAPPGCREAASPPRRGRGRRRRRSGCRGRRLRPRTGR
jgi:hypothetical protein